LEVNDSGQVPIKSGQARMTMINFWQSLKKPFFALAPMDGVTDSVFRKLVASVAKPDVLFSEFINVEGLFSKGAVKIERRLRFSKIEHPIVAQIWGLKPEFFYKAAQLLAERGFDGIDINMGCPKRDVTKRGACGALIKNKCLAKEIIQATKGGSNLPVSVKTRIGYSQIETEEWIGFLLEQSLDAITVHGRTVKEMSKAPAHWDQIGKAVKLRDLMNKSTIIIGNGDVKCKIEGIEKAKMYGVDGIMIGRGIFEDAWVFSSKEGYVPTIVDRLDLLLKHLELYENEKGEKLAYHTLKKYFKIYIRDFNGAFELREKLMETNSTQQVKNLILGLINI
jgi:tRNA-dihydrouridine synthase